MNLRFLGSLFLCLITTFGFSQQAIVLDHNGTPSVFSRLDSAVAAATNGDNIYISGGSFDLGGIMEIDKTINIYGAGHDPDSSQATNTTVLSGSIRFVAGSDNAMMTGIRLTEDILFGTDLSDDNVSGVSIVRCNIEDLHLTHGVIDSNDASNVSLTECIIEGSINGGYSNGLLIDHCIVIGRINYLDYATFRNNIFVYQYPTGNSSSPCNDLFRFSSNHIYCSTYSPTIFHTQFINNIFLDPLASGVSRVRNCTFKRNAFVNGSVSSHTSNILNGNIYGFQSSDFVAYDPNPYDSDFQLTSSSSAKNAAEDGGEIGIYGGSQPFKEGSIPVNPHIRSQIINVQGNAIQLQIEVEAQKR